MATGAVRWFVATAGFGSIQPADGSRDVLVHICSVERAGLSNFSEGQKRAYELVAHRRSGKVAADDAKAM